MARRVTIFVALLYSKEIAETCAMDAVALKVYELKSKCLFYEYLTFLFEKISPCGSKTKLYVLVVGSVEKFLAQGNIVKTKSNGTNHSCRRHPAPSPPPPPTTTQLTTRLTSPPPPPSTGRSQPQFNHRTDLRQAAASNAKPVASSASCVCEQTL